MPCCKLEQYQFQICESNGIQTGEGFERVGVEDCRFGNDGVINNLEIVVEDIKELIEK